MKQELFYIRGAFEDANIGCSMKAGDDLGTKAVFELTGLVNGRFSAEVRPTLNPFKVSNVIITYPDATRKIFGFGDPALDMGDPMLGFGDKDTDMRKCGRTVAGNIVQRFIAKQFQL